MAWASGVPRTLSGPTARDSSATSATPRIISFETALDDVELRPAALSSRTPTRPPTRPPILLQYLVETLLRTMINDDIMEYIVHGWYERAEDEDVTHYVRPRASVEWA